MAASGGEGFPLPGTQIPHMGPQIGPPRSGTGVEIATGMVAIILPIQIVSMHSATQASLPIGLHHPFLQLVCILHIPVIPTSQRPALLFPLHVSCWAGVGASPDLLAAPDSLLTA